MDFINAKTAYNEPQRGRNLLFRAPRVDGRVELMDEIMDEIVTCCSWSL